MRRNLHMFFFSGIIIKNCIASVTFWYFRLPIYWNFCCLLIYRRLVNSINTIDICREIWLDWFQWYARCFNDSYWFFQKEYFNIFITLVEYIFNISSVKSSFNCISTSSSILTICMSLNKIDKGTPFVQLLVCLW